MDQMGCFPITSSWGNKYQMVAVELDGNFVDAKPMKIRTTHELIQAYQNILRQWTATDVISSNWHILDNKSPEEFKMVVCTNKCKVELVPPDMHQCNNAK